MGPSSFFSALLILNFTLEGASNLQKLPPGIKPGRCPIDKTKCRHDMLGECSSDSDCLGVKKCCYISCRYRCLDPGEAQLTRIRLCDEVAPILYCKLPCEEDKDCRNQKGCCHSYCGDICFLSFDAR